jgi:DNA-binding LacI/PurR family transcriptional regulator/DNA-binding transcriptional regulator YhcF (GntR family)
MLKRQSTLETGARSRPDFRSVFPLYAQARAKIEEMIAEKNLLPNDQLPTVRQISSTIGISRATISKAIIQMVEEGILAGRQGKGVFLNFPPGQPIASKLKTVYVLSGGRPTFGQFEDYLVHTPFWNEILTGIRQGFSEGHDHIRLRFAMLPQFVAEEDAVPRKRRWDEIGFIIMADPTPENFEKIIRLKASMVMVHCRRHEEAVPTINADFIQGMEMVVDHLVGLRHRRIVFCGQTMVGQYNTGGVDVEKVAGFKRAMEKHGLAVNETQNIRNCSFGTEEGYRVAQSILATKDRPTALIMCNDELAIGAIRAIREAGLRVPEDISVAGFDNISIGRFVCPSLTTIATRMQEIGRLSVQKLFSVHEGGDKDSISLKPELLVRESTGPAMTGENAGRFDSET